MTLGKGLLVFQGYSHASHRHQGLNLNVRQAGS
jgi:hypothetical protein